MNRITLALKENTDYENFELKPGSCGCSQNSDVLLLPLARDGHLSARGQGRGRCQACLRVPWSSRISLRKAGRRLAAHPVQGVEARRVLLWAWGISVCAKLCARPCKPQRCARPRRVAPSRAAAFATAKVGARGHSHNRCAKRVDPLCLLPRPSHQIQRPDPWRWASSGWACQQGRALATPFTKGRQSVALGHQLAKEWGNRPPTMPRPPCWRRQPRTWPSTQDPVARCMGPNEVAKLGMGAFMAVAQGSKEPLQFIELQLPGRRPVAGPGGAGGQGHHVLDTGGHLASSLPQPWTR